MFYSFTIQNEGAIVSNMRGNLKKSHQIYDSSFIVFVIELFSV